MIKAYRTLGNRLEPVCGPVQGGVQGDVKDIAWIDVLSPSSEEDHHVEKLLGVSLPTREEMEEIEVSARLYHEDNAEFMTLTAVVRSDTEEPGTSPITFVLKNNTLVTLRYDEPKGFANYVMRAQKPGAVPCSGGELIMMA